MDRGVITVAKELKTKVNAPEVNKTTEAIIYQALDQGELSNNSIISQRGQGLDGIVNPGGFPVSR
jgi:hypothetical protein